MRRTRCDGSDPNSSARRRAVGVYIFFVLLRVYLYLWFHSRSFLAAEIRARRAMCTQQSLPLFVRRWCQSNDKLRVLLHQLLAVLDRMVPDYTYSDHARPPHLVHAPLKGVLVVQDVCLPDGTKEPYPDHDPLLWLEATPMSDDHAFCSPFPRAFKADLLSSDTSDGLYVGVDARGLPLSAEEMTELQERGVTIQSLAPDPRRKRGPSRQLNVLLSVEQIRAVVS